MISRDEISPFSILVILILMAGLLAVPACLKRESRTTQTPPAEIQIDPIDINNATAGDFEALPGIGEARAASIIEFRNKYGRFTRKEQLMLVDGIGEKRYKNIENLIAVKEGAR